MGFSGKDRLTVESVKDRRRVLAKKHHPDRGGSVATMARINDAADVLLASL
jgi:curved DNA-binding protein CbpA